MQSLPERAPITSAAQAPPTHAPADCIEDPNIPILRTLLEANDLTVHLLRHHASKRCVLHIRLQTPRCSIDLIGKLYANDRFDVYRLMEVISSLGFGRSGEFSIPQPIGYLRPLQLLLQQKVVGQPSTEAFLSKNEFEYAAERCARCLASFHAVSPRMGPRLEEGTYLRSLERWARRFVPLGEPLAGKAVTLFKQLEAMGTGLCGNEQCTIHGDFTHHQVIFSQSSTVIVDWDNYALANPVRDLARFAIGLKRLALRCLGSVAALDAAAEIFLCTYGGVRRSHDPKRITLQEAAICLEHAKHDIHKQANGWRERAEITLNEGLRILERGA